MLKSETVGTPQNKKKMEKLIEIIGIEGVVGLIVVGIMLVLMGRWSKGTPKVEKRITLEEAFSSVEAIDKITKEGILAKVNESLNDLTVTDRQFGEDLGNIRKFWRNARDIVPVKGEP